MVSLFRRVSFGVLLLVAVRTIDAAQPRISLTNKGISGVEIVNGGSIPAGVVAALKSNSADGMLPYTVVVRNTGSLPVTGLDIRYGISTKGTEVSRDFLYLSPVDVASATSIPIIAPGGSVVISPYHRVNEQMMGRGSLSLSNDDIAGIGNALDFLNGADEITISVDSLIRSDGTMVGPDLCLRFRSFQRQISTYTEFRNELLARFAGSATDADIIAWLQQIASLQLVKPMNGPPDRGLMLEKMKAREYLRYMEQGKRQYAWDALKGATPERALGQIFKVHQEGVQ